MITENIDDPLPPGDPRNRSALVVAKHVTAPERFWSALDALAGKIIGLEPQMSWTRARIGNPAYSEAT